MDDLYDDLDVSELQTQEESAKFAAVVAERDAFQKRISELEKELSDQKERNELLQNNISKLYYTAKREIARKDDLLKDMRNKLYEINEQNERLAIHTS